MANTTARQASMIIMIASKLSPESESFVAAVSVQIPKALSQKHGVTQVSTVLKELHPVSGVSTPMEGTGRALLTPSSVTCEVVERSRNRFASSLAVGSLARVATRGWKSTWTSSAPLESTTSVVTQRSDGTPSNAQTLSEKAAPLNWLAVCVLLTRVLTAVAAVSTTICSVCVVDGLFPASNATTLTVAPPMPALLAVNSSVPALVIVGCVVKSPGLSFVTVKRTF